MTPDVEQIRAALAVEVGDPDWFQQRKVLRQNAPVWLASLADEVERLRAAQTNDTNYLGELAASLVAEREAALAELDTARKALDTLMEIDDDAPLATAMGLLVRRTEQREAALAECERLRAELAGKYRAWSATIESLMAWRSCADQLAAELHDANQLIDSEFALSGEGGDHESDALAVYETLKGADS